MSVAMQAQSKWRNSYSVMSLPRKANVPHNPPAAAKRSKAGEGNLPPISLKPGSLSQLFK
jgi:hypothetical protein